MTSDNIDRILQQQHGVIEASAGTGKTYTIQELVLRLLKSGTPLPQILILTYTEAATSELRQRIRARILEDGRTAGVSPATIGTPVLLQQAVEQFDAAAIYTIHGFCQRALTRHAFENRQPFALEVIDDRPLYQRFLREEQRQLWPQLLGRGVSQEVLADFLALSGYPGDERHSWEAAVIEIARSWRPEMDRLSPAPPEDLAGKVESESRKIESVRSGLLAFLQAPKNSILTPALFDECIQQVQGLSASVRNALRDYVVEPLCMEHLPDDRERLVAWVKRLEPNGRVFLDRWYANGFACLADGAWNKVKKGQEAARPAQEKRLAELISALRGLDGLKQFFGCLGTFTAHRLRHKVDAYKTAHGLLSFEDMLTRLERALDPAKNPAAPQLLQALRAQYTVALVDEFQDTDPVQWSILKRIFVGGKDEKLEQRLFVIGDPKQAIYGFRGADVAVYQEACRQLSGQAPPGNAKEQPRLRVSYRSTSELLSALNRLFQAREQEPWFGSGSGIPYTPVAAPQEGRKVELHYPALGRAAVNLVDLRGAASATAARKDMARFVAREIARLLDWHGSPGEAALRLVAERKRNAASGPTAFEGVPPAVAGETLAPRERGLEASDIAILVDVRRTAALFERALDEYRPPIPHTFYKKEGLYQSEEARHLSILLQALADPGDHAAFRKALLTHFFRVRAEDLEAFAELPPEHPIKQLYQRWRQFALRRNWARLFQSILEDTGVLWCYQPTPVARSAGFQPALAALRTCRQDACATPDMERRGTNYQHILEELEDAARRRHLDFAGVCAELEARRQGLLSGSEDSDLHRLESEDPKVRIMTIHASKGLEFPVVFVCAGFTESRSGGLFTKYHGLGADGRRLPALVYDLGPGRQNNSQREEKEEETSRLYYVALTRAQCLLYAPYLPLEKETGGNRRAGAASRLLCPAMDAAWPGECDGTTVARIDKALNAKSEIPNPKSQIPNPKSEIRPPPGWLDPLGPDRMYITAADTVQSFSALSQSRPRPVLVLGDEKQRDWDEETVLSAGVLSTEGVPGLGHSVLSTQYSVLSSDVLPSGHHAGLALHEILEQIDLRAVREAGSWEELLRGPDGSLYQDLLGRAMEKHGLHERGKKSSAQLAGDPYAQAMTRLVWTALRAELPDFPDGKLRLCDLDEADRLHELEFNLPLPSWRDLPCNTKSGTWEDCKRALRAAWPAVKFADPLEHTTGYLNGVIDLVFRAAPHPTLSPLGRGQGEGRHCRYYVLDWKSNRLAAGFSPAVLTSCMRENSYDVQSHIYTLALLRWLAQCRIPAGQFGGVYYVFLRGVDEANPGAGFFRDFTMPRQEDLITELFVWLNRRLDFGF